jgi:Uma2 family endonuclease
MAVTAPAEAATPAEDQDGPLRQFSVVEYDRMIRDGILDERDQCELLDGRIVLKMARNAPHDSSAYRLQVRLFRLLGDDWVVRGQSGVTLPRSVPEPDVAVAPGPDSRYDAARPTPRQLVMVAEVADSSLGRDRGRKLRIYAQARIPVYWIVNLRDRQVEVYTLPRGGKNPTYRARTVYPPGQTVPVVVAGQPVGSIPVSELLP